jgi:hypothetical protein
MFNLEEKISEWRQQMLAAGIKTPVPLEELEIHLREEIERQMKSGLSAQQAFGIAVEKIGQASDLKMEFKKVSAPMEIQKIIKLAGVTCVAVALVCQLLTCSPVVFVIIFAHGLRVSLMTRALALAILVMPVAITFLSWKYNHRLLPVIRNQLLRRSAGIVCYMGCLLWIRFVLFHMPNGFNGNGGKFWPLFYFLFGLQWTVMAILGGVGHGLEKAASKKSAAVDSLAGQN